MSLRAQHQGKWVERRARTDTAGRFVLEHLPEVDLSFSVAAAGYLYLSEFPVPPGVRDTEILLERAGVLAGRVLDGRDGSPLDSFTVRLVRPVLEEGEELFLGYAATWAREGHRFNNADGSWSTGEERLRPSAAFGVEVRAEGFASKVMPRVLAEVEPDPDALVVSLFPGTRLFGQVMAGTAPVSGAKVMLRRADGGRTVLESTHDLVMTHTDASGLFELRGLADGEVHLAVEHPDWAFLLHGPIELLPGQVEQGVHVTMDEGLALSGQLRDGAGRPRPGVEVRLEVERVSGMGEREWTMRTDDQGRYRFERLPEGIFRLRDHFGGEWAWGSTVARYVEVRSPGPVLRDLEPAGDGGAIHGRLDLPAGHREPVTVRLEVVRDGDPEDWEGALMPRQTVAVEGGFTFSNLPAGRYRIVATSLVTGVAYTGTAEIKVEVDAPREVTIEVRRSE